MTARILLDNTILSNFGRSGADQLLTLAWDGAVCTTRVVLNEYRSGLLADDPRRDVWSSLAVIELTAHERQLAASLPQPLHDGERSCLAVAVGRGWLAATDDLDARRYAAARGIVVSGTLGTLIRAVRHRHATRDDAEDLLRRMIADGYRSPVDSLDALL